MEKVTATKHEQTTIDRPQKRAADLLLVSEKLTPPTVPLPEWAQF